MTALGHFGRMPLRMGGGRSRAQAIYESLRDGIGTAFSRDSGTRANAELRADAFAIARAQSAQERGGLQSLPDLASDRLDDWERALQAPVDPADPPHVRAAVCSGILKGNSFPERDAIAAAVSTALAGESVTVIVAVQNPKSWSTSFVATPVCVAVAGGNLAAGAHYVNVATEDASGNVEQNTTPTLITTTAGQSIVVSGVTNPGVTVRFYLSTKAGSQQLALAASNFGGTPITLADYPSNPPLPGLHHVTVLVSAATASDTTRRAKVHAVLGAMLSAWTTYDIAAASPFILGSSLLGRSAL